MTAHHHSFFFILLISDHYTNNADFQAHFWIRFTDTDNNNTFYIQSFSKHIYIQHGRLEECLIMKMMDIQEGSYTAQVEVLGPENGAINNWNGTFGPIILALVWMMTYIKGSYVFTPLTNPKETQSSILNLFEGAFLTILFIHQEHTSSTRAKYERSNLLLLLV